MELHELPGMNRKLTPPGDWDEEKHGACATLPVFAEVKDGLMHMTSAWKPDAEELVALSRGSSVALTILGSNHPPIAIGVFSMDHIPKGEDEPPQYVPGPPEEYSAWERRVFARGYTMGHAVGLAAAVVPANEDDTQRRQRLEAAVLAAARALQDDMGFGASYLPGNEGMGVYVGTASSVAALANGNAMREGAAERDKIMRGNEGMDHGAPTQTPD